MNLNYFKPLLILLTAFFSCKEKIPKVKLSDINIIPQVNSITQKNGNMTIDEKTTLYISSDVKNFENFEYIQKHLSKLFHSVKFAKINQNNQIVISKGHFENDEAYSIEVITATQTLLIKAKKSKGIFYALQSLKQILPTDIFSNVYKKEFLIPAISIKDVPRFSYRGMHLDVGRHLFSVQDIKKYIDYIAMHKMNTFHWHLTEDQGWRIEIKKYPKLTEIGAYRDGIVKGQAYNDKPLKYDKERYGGFYTQEQIRDIVKYAQEKFITIIPEIEFLGHSTVALTAYPELSCRGIKQRIKRTRGMLPKEVYCTKEINFQFMENVLSEVLDLFPSKYIHIGGDKAPKNEWNRCKHCRSMIKKENLVNVEGLQSYFIKRIEKFLNGKNRKLIGCDEILEGGLGPHSTVMSCRGIQGVIEAVKERHDVIMTPSTHCYFDHYQDNKTNEEPLAIGGLTTLKDVYHYEPVPTELNKEQAKHILGAQGNVWSEYMKTFKDVEYMVFPRISALSEVVWTTKKDWKNFSKRMKTQYKRYDALGINYKKR